LRGGTRRWIGCRWRVTLGRMRETFRRTRVNAGIAPAVRRSVFVGLLVVSLASAPVGCRRFEAVPLLGADMAVALEHEETPRPVSVERRPDGAQVHLDAATRERIGLRVLLLAGIQLQGTVRGFGHLLDPAALATPVYDYEAARAAFEAADSEFRRVQGLHRGTSIASERDLEAARVAFERERAALASAHARVTALWGIQAAKRDDLSKLVESLIARETAVARIDLPLGTTVSIEPTAGRVVAVADRNATPIDATVLGPAADADPTIQGLGFLLLVERPPWPPGTALDGWITVPAEPRIGVVVPESAILRHQGASMVYVETDDGVFSRRAVRLEQPTSGGWFVAEGLAPGNVVVVGGAQQLLSTELGGVGEEE
jgi:membrane fusion protein, multidrug efflux system